MKGLLIKDLKLLKNNTQFFLIMGGISLVFLAVYSNVTFVISYATIMFSMFSISSISYDRYDNGMSFLFALPISRRDYVNSKYVFALILIVGAMSVSSFMTAAASLIRGLEFMPEDCLVGAASALLCAGTMTALTIPLSLKFEAEKSRMVMPAVIGIIFLFSYGAVKLIEALGIEKDMLEVVRQIESADVGVVCGVIAGITAIFLLLSWLISFKIMLKKEF